MEATRKASPSHRKSVPNLASQRRVAFARMAWKTGCSSPGELLMTCSTPEVAVCCSRASASSRVRASSCFFNSISELGPLLTCALAFVPVERSLRLRVGLFAPLRAKITSSAQSLVLCWSPKLRKPSNREHSTLGLLCEIVHTNEPNDQTSLPTNL